MDDLGLLERMQRGDEGAFTELFDRHKMAVHRYAAHMGGPGNVDAADDIVQETFLAFLRQLSQFDAARGTVQGYLLGIARRLVFKRFAASRVDDGIDVEGDRVDGAMCIPSPAGDPLEALSRAEIVERVRAAIATLPPAFREVVVLCELNELGYAAAASVINCPIGTVRSRLHRARAQLVAKLAEMRPGAIACP